MSHSNSFPVLVGAVFFVLCASVRADLVAHWPLDTDAVDLAGGHDGLASGGVVFGAEGAAEYSGTAAEFDGSSAAITVPYSPELNPESFTVAMWASADSADGFASAITSRDDDGSSVHGYIIYNDSQGRWNFWTGGGGPSGAWRQAPGPAVEVGSWTHLAISYDAPTETMSLYVNGALEQSVAGPNLYSPNGPEAEDLHLGSGADNGSQFFFDGLLDEVALWDEALSTSEILEVMTNGVPNAAPEIVSFAANPLSIASGESATLSWQTLRAASLAIEPGIGAVAGADGSVVVTPSATTTYTLTAAGDSGSAAVRQVTVGVDVPAAAPVISEFVADNETGLTDSEGDREDWIELHNPNSFAIDLGGWSLTDNPARLDKWVFSERTLAPGGYLVVFASEKDGPLDLNFRLAASGEYLALVSPDGEIVQEFAPGYPPQFDDIAFGQPAGGGAFVSLTATPGAANGPGLVEIAPAIREVTENPPPPAEDDPLLITARIEPRLGAIENVLLTYRVLFGPERRVAMTAIGGSEWSAAIPASAYEAGEMVRWYVTASTAGGEISRAPAFPDATESAEYFGTVVDDPASSSTLPVLHWFVENPNRGDTRSGTQASLFFAGRFYDNIFCRIRGQSTANWPKHKYKFDFYRGGHFFWKEGAPKVEEFNVNSHYRDGYVRENGIFAFLNEAGSPSPETMYLWIRRNGEDFGLFSFVEQIDEEFLSRHGFDASGPMYKAINVPATLSPTVNSSLYRKVLQRTEPYDDLVDFARQINRSNPNRFQYVADEVNLPNYINVMAAMAVPFNHDQLTKNYYLYRDPHRAEWFRFAWDGDQGYPTGQKITHENWASPLYGDAQHTQELVNGNPNPTWQNHMHANILDNPITREMYLRRLRNLADEYLRPRDEGAGGSWFEDMFAGFESEIAAAAERDFALWSNQGIGTLENGLFNVLRTSLTMRRRALFRTYGPSGTGLLPAAEPPDPVVMFGAIDSNPSSGDQDDEFIEIVNENDFAIDLSGWQIEGGVSFTFPPGAVIPAAGADPERGKVFVSPDVTSFRRRPASPTGRESRIVLGNYDGHLSNFGEVVTLLDDTGREVADVVLPTEPSDVQRYLAVSEIMYRPAGDRDAEFIELVNTSDSVTLDLTGVAFASGVQFDFSGSSVTLLAPGERVLVVRDLAAFQDRYGTGSRVAGEFANGTALSNGGERLKLDDASGSTVFEFDYLDTEPWPTAADGGGYSLVAINPGAGRDLDDPASWRTSVSPDGSPGADDAVAYDGGDLLVYTGLAGPEIQIDRAAGEVLVTHHQFLGSDEAHITVEWSTDLLVWETGNFSLAKREPDGFGAEVITLRSPLAPQGFVRLRVTLVP